MNKDIVDVFEEAAKEAGMKTVKLEPEVAKVVFDKTKVIVCSAASFVLGLTTGVIAEKKIFPLVKGRKKNNSKIVDIDDYKEVETVEEEETEEE